MKYYYCVVACLLLLVVGGSASSFPDEDWGYVTVREKAHMFWWLYGAETDSASKPLIIWLQGGPGGSSTGFGNFLEIGPLDVNLQPRNETWIKAANLLFVDNPVGTGFSYVEDDSAYCTNNQQVSNDLVSLLKGFLQAHPEYSETPLYIFSESYGGKMASGFANALNIALKEGEIVCAFSGVALGDSWISPQSFTDTWAPYLKTMSLVDANGEAMLNKQAAVIRSLIAQGKFEDATNEWGNLENMVELATNNVNFYNILTLDDTEGAAATSRAFMKAAALYERNESPMTGLMKRHLAMYHSDSLSEIMNGPIRAKLKIIPQSVTWGGQSSNVFSNLSGDFMKPVVDTVDFLLGNKTNVIVYNGQLDLICDTPGTEAWVDTLQWPGLAAWKAAIRAPMYPNPDTTLTGAFVKASDNFSFYYIMRAGHMVPADQPEMAFVLMNTIVNNL